MNRVLAALGPVRLPRLTSRDSVSRNGTQIVAHTNEPLIARVREARAEWERNADPMEGIARIIRASGTLTW